MLGLRAAVHADKRICVNTKLIETGSYLPNEDENNKEDEHIDIVDYLVVAILLHFMYAYIYIAARFLILKYGVIEIFSNW